MSALLGWVDVIKLLIRALGLAVPQWLLTGTTEVIRLDARFYQDRHARDSIVCVLGVCNDAAPGARE